MIDKLIKESKTDFIIFKVIRKGTYILTVYNHCYILNNHMKYKDYIITDMETFLVNNKEIISSRRYHKWL
ncbi:hypothetical protein WCLP8_3270022 [uncultured Gammaproteobacteria bacterium]